MAIGRIDSTPGFALFKFTEFGIANREGKIARESLAAQPVRGGLPPVRSRNLPGYAWQFFIPGLTPAPIQETRRQPA